MQGKMTTIYPNGLVTEKEFHNDTPTLLELQEAVGGLIELVPLFEEYKDHRCVVFCNEEGIQKELDHNPFATEEWFKASGMEVSPGNLLGNVIILTGDKEFMESL